jgi:hypothetical protein
MANNIINKPVLLKTLLLKNLSKKKVNDNIDNLNINELNINESNINTKNAVIVLTRGYTDINKYDMLIKRNISIEKNLINKSIDILIFNENNISLEQQNHIKSFTPKLNILFINILEKAFLDDKKYIKVDKSIEKFSLGYRHMCSFWFVNFWNYVENYDKILRIDEDCIIDFNIDKVFYLLNDKVSIYGKWEKDCDYVTKGLNQFTINFLNNNLINNNLINNRTIYGPYTNIIALNLDKLRQNKLLFKYIDEVDKSNNIYTFRWGDLPLWGEVLLFFYNKEDHLLTSYIKYYHKSHNRYVNM